MKQDMLYENVIKPLLFRMDPEDAHNFVHRLLRSSAPILQTLPYRYEADNLRINLFGKTLANPIGLAAGFDKNAHLVEVLKWLGFGFAEIGSITARATAGNPRPRLFRLPDDEALINRLGLNGDGAEAVAARLRLAKPSLPLSVNIAKTHDPSISGDKAVEDILISFNAVKDMDLLYVALNASCPNTREGCMKEKEELHAVLTEMQKINQRRLPLLIKVSPDSSDQLVEDILELGERCRLSGYICGNTTIDRQNLMTPTFLLEKIGHGGLSGKPLKPLALRMCRRFAQAKQASQVVIAVGGIASGADAFEFIEAGATAIELYTGLIYKGPGIVRQMCEELSWLLDKNGISLNERASAPLQGY
jgi:dihydroorotate dehydrogenase